MSSMGVYPLIMEKPNGKIMKKCLALVGTHTDLQGKKEWSRQSVRCVVKLHPI